MGRLYKTSGFTLVELVITVAIMLMLISLAMPTFQRLRYGAREAEAQGNLNAIKTCQEAYKAEKDSYLKCDPNPLDIPSTQGADWVGNEGFNKIGFNPSGKVRYQYAVESNASDEFTATAVGDIDGDTNPATFQITNNTNVEKITDGIF